MSTLNKKYFDNLIRKINSIPSCDQELFKILTQVSVSLQPIITKLEEEIAADAALIIPPTTLPAVISWINKIIQRYVVPYEKKLAELAFYAAQIASVIQTVESKVRNCLDYKTLLNDVKRYEIHELVNIETGILTKLGEKTLIQFKGQIETEIGTDVNNTVNLVTTLKRMSELGI